MFQGILGCNRGVGGCTGYDVDVIECTVVYHGVIGG